MFKQLVGGEGLSQQAIRNLLNRLRGVGAIEPKWSGDGAVTYPALGDAGVAAEQDSVLEYLVRSGYLVKNVVESVHVCPVCGKAALLASLKCPRCGSPSIEFERLLEHRRGGHIHSESAFKADEGLKCPTCGAQLRGESDYKVVGQWFSCRSCGSRFTSISPELRCPRDGTVLKSDSVTHIYRYTLTEKALKADEADRSSLAELVYSLIPSTLNPTKDALKSGQSGVQHRYDIEAGGAFIDILHSQQPIDEKQILAQYAKKLDSGIKEYVLIAWPGLNGVAQSLAQFYKMVVVEASTISELTEKVKALVDRLASSKANSF